MSNDPLAVARMLLTDGNPDRAAGATRECVRLNPNDHRAWHLLSLAQPKSGQISHAQASIAQAIALAPEDIGVRLQHSQYLIANGPRRGALVLAGSLAHIDLPRADWNDALGTLFALCDEPLRALPLLQLAVAQAPTDIQ